ncbi:hypothetical protein [Sodalis sp. dw_96]|uniref:hypothetical protein n=1 Tax=Sodalis sp. dw_96 TaxID=2719794 RepID=UPI001BD3AF2A|nr:hypothetical protein [Sodalis sp. dw_96]
MNNISCSGNSYPPNIIHPQTSGIIPPPVLHQSSLDSSVASGSMASGWEKKTARHKVSPPSAENNLQHCAQEEINADNLFSCVAELKRNIDFLLKAKGSKYVTLSIEGKKSSILAKIVVLPSGREIYVGNLSGKMMVSDGTLYHLEHTSANQNSVISSLMLAWAHGSMAFCQPPSQHATRQSDADLPRPGYDGFQSATAASTAVPQIAAHSWYSPIFSVWTNIIMRPAEALLNAFTLPGAAATETRGSPDDIFEEEWPNDIKDLIKDEITPIPMRNGCHPSRDYLNEDNYFVVDKSLTFMIDGKKTTLSMPHRDAQSEFEHWVSVFSLTPSPSADSLEMLLSFDQYIGEKVQLTFDKGNILSKEKKYVHLILLKGMVEKIINGCLERTEVSTATQTAIKKYEKKQIKINRFLKTEAIDLKNLFSESEMDMIYETLEFKRGVTFEDAKGTIHALYKDADYEQKEKYVKYYKILLLMEEAKIHYCNELNAVPNSTTLERVLYKNDMQLLEAIFNENIEIANSLIKKRIFYSVFEFTRGNDVSLQTENLLMPGELTKYNTLFQQPEHEVIEDDLLKNFSAELTNYLNLRNEHGSNLTKTLKVIELFRENDEKELNVDPWHEINLMPFKRAKKLFFEIIHSSQEKKTYIALPATWQNDYNTQLFNDKISYINSDILISLQMDFNKIVSSILDNGKFIEAESEEQRIIQAKLAAVALTFPSDLIRTDYDSHLISYKDSVSQGYISVLISAAAYWYLSTLKAESLSHTLRDAHVLTIVRQFVEQEHNIATELNLAASERFSSVYTLKPSNEFDDKRDYYNQFIDYKINTIKREAKYKTFFAIKHSSIGYYDLIYNPQEVYTFKVYSRKYIQNTLANAPSVLSPATNLGFVSIAKTETNRLFLISTLADFTYINDVTELMDDLFISRIIKEWVSAPDRLETKSRNKFAVTLRELQLLFCSSEQDNNDSNFSMDLLLIKPQENEYSTPSSEITFSAVKEIDLNQNLRDFIDTLNVKTLLEICNGLKFSLIKPTWIDFITMNIPFYHTLEKYWYDADMTLRFEDVIFDIFDLLITLIPAGVVAGRLPKNFIVTILSSAKSKNIPKQLFRSFLIAEFAKILPGMSLSLAKKASSDLLGFISPLPLSLQSTLRLPLICYKGLKINMHFVNSRTKTQRIFRENLRNKWSMKTTPEKLKPLRDGIYIEDEWSKTARHFIKDRNDIFQVQRDETNNVWRVLDPGANEGMNNAVAVAPHGVNAWEINPLDVKIESPAFSYHAPALTGKNIIPDIEFEKFPPVLMSHATEDNYAESHLRVLSFFLTENDYYINELLSSHFSRDSILLALSDRLKGNVSKAQIFSSEDYTSLQNNLIEEFYSLSTKFETNISFRAINFWIDKLDYSPINHILINYKIGNNVYILDLQALRPPKNINTSTTQVYLENDWLRKYKTDLPSTLTLVKYKDYIDIDEALLFSKKGHLSPSQVIENSYLLREPAWYLSSVLKNSHTSMKKAYPITSGNSPGFRGICRKSFRNLKSMTPFEALPPKVLEEAGFIDKDQAKVLLSQLNISKSNIIPAGAFLDAGALIPNLDIFIRINPGKLVLYYDQIGILSHAQVSIGNGRFASIGNAFFDPQLSDRPAILTAEELGVFYGKTLELRHNNMKLTVIAGSIKGSEETLPTIAPTKMILKTLAVKGHGEEVIEKLIPMPREEMLLGKHWEMSQVPSLKDHIQIKVHGMPFNVNYMDAMEFSHVVRGLMLAKPDTYPLATLRQIDLFSCFSGFGGKYSMAQVLANELQVRVKAYPSMISKDIEQRHPSWFHIYQPMNTDLTGNKNRYVFERQNDQLQGIISMHTQLHDFVSYLAQLRTTFFPIRGKRAVAGEPKFIGLPYIPSIQTALAKLILGILPLHQFIMDFDIAKETEIELKRLITDYRFEENDPDDNYFQLYFDIICSIERFKDIGNGWKRFSTP